MGNSWIDPPYSYSKQSVERIEVLAYLDCHVGITIEIVVVNDILTEVVLPHGLECGDFDDLRSDIYSTLFWLGLKNVDLSLLDPK